MSVKTKEMIQAEYDAAMAELDTFQKSQTEVDELDELTKSLEAELAGDPLLKSHAEPDADNKGGKSDGDKDNEEEDEGAEPDDEEMEKSLREAAEAEELRKSQEAEEYEEYVHAAECYEALEKSVKDSHTSIADQLGTISKGMASIMNLNIKMAGVISAQSTELANLKKSREEDADSLQKSLASFGAKPVMPNTAVLGVGRVHEEKETPMAKSKSEVSELLFKAVSDKKVDSKYLSIFSVYGTAECLGEDVRKIIGI